MVFYRDFLLIFPSFQFLRLDVSFLCPVFLCSVSLCVCVSLSFVLFALQAQKYCSKSPFDGHISDNNNNYSFSNYIFCVCLSFLFLFNCCTIVRHRFAFSIIPFEMASVGISVIRTNNTKWRRVECHIQLQDFNDMIWTKLKVDFLFEICVCVCLLLAQEIEMNQNKNCAHTVEISTRKLTDNYMHWHQKCHPACASRHHYGCGQVKVDG